MQLVLLIFGILAFLTGILLLVAPKALLKAGEVLNRMLAIDDVIFSQRLIFGIFLLLAGAFMIYRYYLIP
jgi:hypothetical protein